MPKSKIVSASFRLATADDAHLPAYDNTKLQAYNTCPTWGIVTYQMHKVMKASGRAMALEAGTVMHEVFSFVRLVTLVKQLENEQRAWAHVWRKHGIRLFGEERWGVLTSMLEANFTDDVDLIAKQGAIAVLETSDYYDDPADKRRTINNLTECAFAYIDRWDWNKRIWMRDEREPTGDVGIEIPFDLVVSVLTEEGGWKNRRYTGKIDGISVNNKGTVSIDENKTASRLSDAWSMAFEVNTQPTGYMIAASVFTETTIRDATIYGLAIPLPKSYDYGGIMRVHVNREEHHIRRWINWFHNTAEGYEQNADNPHDADRYTHSCNRYFRPCSLIPFCAVNDEEAKIMLTEMHHKEWSPLDKEVIGE